jgi:DNA-binding PadR family transcriptional regulator
MTKDEFNPADFLPLSPAVFHVMLSLADGDKHGYAILKEVEKRTEGQVRLSTGTLYAIVKRLLNDGLIEELEERPSTEDDQRRRYYRLTKFGRDVSIAEARRMEEIVETARGKRLLRRLRHV